MNIEDKLAQRTKNMSASAIREILKVVGLPGMISLAGGNPDPSTFPIEFIKNNIHQIIDKYGSTLFQYGITEGFDPLRIALSQYLKSIGIKVDYKSVFISTGAQSAINTASAVLVDKGDKVGVEAPTYLNSLKTFKTFEPEFIELITDKDGIIPAELIKTIQKHKLKLIYLQPNFQNPTGQTIPNDRRIEIAKIIKEHELIAIEDDPYHELNFSNQKFTTLYELVPENIIYIGSLSKIFSPGLRLGFYLGPSVITEKMVSIKQGIDINTDVFAQAIATEYLNSDFFRKNLKYIQDLYSTKALCMINAINQFFPSEIEYTDVLGGMFIWCKYNKSLNTSLIYQESIEQKVAFVPGSTFFITPPENFTMRLNF